MWDTGMITVQIYLLLISTKKVKKFKARVRKSSTIKDIKKHLKASKDIDGRVTDKHLSDEMTLTEAKLITRPELNMESYKTPKRFTHNISVELPDGELKNVQVHEGTTVEELKHQIQDETGMPYEEQILEYSGKTVKQNKSIVGICGYKKVPFTLKWRKRENKRQNPPSVKSSRSREDEEPSSCAGTLHTQPPSTSTSADVLAEKPVLAQLMKIKTIRGEKIYIIKSVARQWKDIGDLLDFDTEGQTLELIEADHKQEGHAACCREVFTFWLKGNGRKATWEVLIELLDDIDRSELANQVKTAIESMPSNQQGKTIPTTNPSLAAKPTLSKLKLIKMKTTREGKISIIKSVAPQWKDLGALFDFDPEGHDIEVIEADYRQEGHAACCREMFLHWIKGNGKEATWEVLIELLDDIDKKELANQVKTAIESK